MKLIDIKNKELIRHQLRNTVSDKVNNKIWMFVLDKIREPIRKQFDEQLGNSLRGDSLRGEVSKKVRSAVWLRIHEQVVNKLFDKFHWKVD